ncbi:MAG TPA: hypothetical protein PKZ56_01040 [Candidatus Paceibacterota bacterium]|nr:hypothetical protein [Candidatus Paceibacterota bacterium]
MKSIFKKISIPLFIAAIAFSAVAVFSLVSANTAYDVTGYAWSDMPNASDQISTPINHYGGRGLGWIQMKGSNYGVTLDTDGTFKGYGWSEFGGYVQFNPSGQQGAQVDPACLADETRDCPVTGWIRFVSAPADLQAGGWDGWVKMSDSSWSNGVTLLKPVNGIRKMTGYAWGDMVVGWVDFKYAQVDIGILGCTDSTASNYNENATIPDGSCLYPILCPDGTPAPNRDVDQCPVDILCPDGTPAPNNNISNCPTPPLCPDGTPVPPSGCSGGGCPTPANYPGMNGYNNLCVCVARVGHPSDCPTSGCKISGDPFYNTSATTTNNSMCFCPSGNYNKSTGACGSCPNPNYPKMLSGYDNTCRCIPRPGQPNDCPTGTKWPGYIEA